MAKPFNIEVFAAGEFEETVVLDGKCRVRFVMSDGYYVEVCMREDGTFDVSGMRPFYVLPNTASQVHLKVRPEFAPLTTRGTPLDPLRSRPRMQARPKIEEQKEPAPYHDGKGRFIIEHPSYGIFESWGGIHDKPRYKREGKRTDGLRFLSLDKAEMTLRKLHSKGGTHKRAYVHQLGTEGMCVTRHESLEKGQRYLVAYTPEGKRSNWQFVGTYLGPDSNGHTLGWSMRPAAGTSNVDVRQFVCAWPTTQAHTLPTAMKVNL